MPAHRNRLDMLGVNLGKKVDLADGGWTGQPFLICIISGEHKAIIILYDGNEIPGGIVLLDASKVPPGEEMRCS